MRTSCPWNSTRNTLETTGIAPYIFLLVEVESLRSIVEYFKVDLSCYVNNILGERLDESEAENPGCVH